MMAKRMSAREKRKLGFRDLRANSDARFYGDPSPGVGVYEVLPYNGPREFYVSAPGHLTDMARSGKVPALFRVIRDEKLHSPYGGFRIYYKEQEVGRTIGWPTYEDCRNAKRNHRRGHGEEAS